MEMLKLFENGLQVLSLGRGMHKYMFCQVPKVASSNPDAPPEKNLVIKSVLVQKTVAVLQARKNKM